MKNVLANPDDIVLPESGVAGDQFLNERNLADLLSRKKEEYKVQERESKGEPLHKAPRRRALSPVNFLKRGRLRLRFICQSPHCRDPLRRWSFVRGIICGKDATVKRHPTLQVRWGRAHPEQTSAEINGVRSVPRES